MNNIIKRIISLAAGAVILFSAAGCATKTVIEKPDEPTEFPTVDDSMAFQGERKEDTRALSDWEYTLYNTVGTDSLGRSFGPVDGVKSDKKREVGMFYFVCLGGHNGSGQDGIYDNNKITNGGTDLSEFLDPTSQISPIGQNHFTAEPIWGYYRSDDPWVIRKQLEMLGMAGIDYITFDVSNNVYYEDAVDQVVEIAREFTEKGFQIPKLSFYCNNAWDRAGIKYLYERYYSKPEYQNIWYCINGKPMITKMVDTSWESSDNGWDANDPLKETLKNYFYFLDRQWPNEEAHDNPLPWMEWTYPQRTYKNGFMSVSAAQHVNSRMSEVSTAHGKGWSPETNSNPENRTDWVAGQNFQSQWQTVYDNDSEVGNVFLTGWNEWVAQKSYDQYYPEPYMVDNFNAEFSRDLEPVKSTAINSPSDNFYMQTIQNIRQWKYTPAQHYIYPEQYIDIRNFDETQWKDASTYIDITGDATRRDSYNFAKTGKYTDTSNRNDIESVSVIRDEHYLYFRITTKDFIELAEDGDKSWMNIYIKTQNGGDDSLHGYQYVINRQLLPGGKTTVYKSKGGNAYTKTGEGRYEVKENVLQVKVPLYTLGLGGKNYDIEFKVTDNIQNPANIDNFYTKGDAAPIGRLSYKYGY